MHPTMIIPVTHTEASFCATEPWKDHIHGNAPTMVDVCDMDPRRKPRNTHRNIAHAVTPVNAMTDRAFIQDAYGISSMAACADWIDTNKHLPLRTRARVLDVCLKSYGDTMGLVDPRLSSFFSAYINEFKARELYDMLNQYLAVQVITGDKDELRVTVSEHNYLAKHDYIHIRTRFIQDEITSSHELLRFMSVYFDPDFDPENKRTAGVVELWRDFKVYVMNRIQSMIAPRK